MKYEKFNIQYDLENKTRYHKQGRQTNVLYA